MDGRVYLIRTVSDTVAFVLGTISCPDMINVLIMNQADQNKQNQFSLWIPILVVHYNKSLTNTDCFPSSNQCFVGGHYRGLILKSDNLILSVPTGPGQLDLLT